MQNKKGNCYQSAGNFIINNSNIPILLCHGLVSGQGKLKGLRIEHAWCELGDIVFDCSNGRNIVMRKEEYYKIGKIKEKEVKRYTQKEAMKLMLKFKYYGRFE